MKTIENLEHILDKIEALSKMNIYPPAKKQQADAIIIEFLKECGDDGKSKEIISRFLELYEKIDGEY
jgi:hypothetical protein